MTRLLPLLLALAGCQTVAREAPPPPPPGLSYAWVTFDASKVRGSGASGLADRAQNRPLTIEDPVRIASVSKLVVALGVMRLVEQGKLDLDRDVSDYLGWQLRNPAFPQVPVTLRLLLSHTSTLQDDGDRYVIPLGRTVRDALADPKAFDATHAPGSYFRYSNLNFPVIGSVMERATGERFDRLMDRLVLEPLGLDACFNWTTCSAGRAAQGVAMYHPDGKVRKDALDERQGSCPVATVGSECDLADYVLGSNGALFSPQGGLRISARDLAKVGQLLLYPGRHGGERFLSAASLETVARPAWRYDGTNGDTSEGFYCAYGLATQTIPTRVGGCRDNLFGDGRAAVGHAGEAYGLLSGLWVDPKRRVGIAYFAVNNPAQPVPGKTGYRAAEEWLAAKLHD